MRYIQFFTTTTFLACLLAQCARPCPADIVLGNVALSSATRSFVPVAQDVATMTFVNVAGDKLEFSSTSAGDQSTEIPVETLCQRGDYLDKTAQVSLYKVVTKRYAYTAANNTYTLDVQAEIENLGPYGSPSDTVFIEKFVTWGQKTTSPVRVGTMSVLSNERGNGAKITDQQRLNYNQFQIVADTVLNGRQIKNAYVTPKDGNQSLFIFYTKEKGIEAFTTDSDIWLRQ